MRMTVFQENFHIIFMSQDTSLLLIFLNHFKKVETILSLQTKQKQEAGHIWSVGHSLLTHGLNYSHPNINLFIQ